jgi:3-oxoacyl-[acyl-carrier-protein] synthase-3
MAGSDVYIFTKRIVESQIRSTVAKAGLMPSDIRVVFPHQASRLVLNELLGKLHDFREVIIDVEHTGNLVSSSIPHLLTRRLDDLYRGINVLTGFGVGLSSSTVVLRAL